MRHACSVIQSCPILCDPMDCSLPGSSSHGISLEGYWSGLPFPSPGHLRDPGIDPVSPALAGGRLSLLGCTKRAYSLAAVCGLFVAWLLSLHSTGPSMDSVAVVHGVSWSVACGILPGQGSNPCSPHWQAESKPLKHQGSPRVSLLTLLFSLFGSPSGTGLKILSHPSISTAADPSPVSYFLTHFDLLPCSIWIHICFLPRLQISLRPGLPYSSPSAHPKVYYNM